MCGHSRNYNTADSKCTHGDQHHPAGTDARDNMTSRDCSDESGDSDGTYLGHGKEWRRSSELLEYLDKVVYEDSWWLSVG